MSQRAASLAVDAGEARSKHGLISHVRIEESDFGAGGGFISEGVAADAIATLEKIDRRSVDALAAESQRRAEIAIKEGRFDRSIVFVG